MIFETKETSGSLTRDEVAFAKRMLVHIQAGKTLKEAAEAVRDDDIRLLELLLDRYYRSPSMSDGRGGFLAKHLSAIVYKKIRSEMGMEAA